MQKIIRKIRAFLSPRAPAQSSHSPAHTTNLSAPATISRDQHGISRSQIDKSALDVLYGLKRAGYEAYLVGGAVRDLLLGLEPKDFDVVTNATPDQIQTVFKRQCTLIGRRFRLAHVRFGRNIIEVATFRGEGEAATSSSAIKKRFGRRQEPLRQVDDTGRLLRDNIYGTMDEDIWRRDFTVNSLYYNIRDFSIIDYAGALEDIQKGQLRLIGDPEERYREDPVRMIRAVRFAAKLGFKIEQATEKPLFELGSLLLDVSNARLFEEVLKLFHSGVGLEVFEKLRHYGLFEFIFPLTHQTLAYEDDHFPKMLVIEALKSTDARIQENKSVNPSFLFAAMLWEPMRDLMEQYQEEGESLQDALHHAANEVLNAQIKSTAIPKRFTAQMREIWVMQFRLPSRHGDRAQKLTEHPRFRAAYDFLGVRVAAGEEDLASLFDWWTQYQEKNPVEQVAFANDIEQPTRRKKRPRRNRNPYRKSSGAKANAGDL